MRTIPDTDPVALELMSAIKTGDVARLKRLLAADSEVAVARIVGGDGFSRTLLHVAADWPGHFPNGAATVAALVAAGADVNAAVIPTDPTRPRETPLHWAASSDDVAVLDALLDSGADIEATGAVFTGGTAMSDAVIFAQWNAARRLMERGAQTTIWQAGALGLLDRVRAALHQRTAAGRSDHERVLARLPRRAARDGRVLPRSRRELELDRLRPQAAARRGARIRRHGASGLAGKPGRQARTRYGQSDSALENLTS